MSYNPNVIFPETISRGAEFSVGYDTHILELESGFEKRVPRMAPWGRRTYNFSRNSCTAADARVLRNFFILRRGATESFKFKDWSDFATTVTGYADDDNPVDFTDVDLQFISGTSYQCVKTISDSGGSVVRPIDKIKASTFRVGVNGTEIFSPNYTLDAETGIVTITGSIGPLTNVTAGFHFYTVVRFADDTDKSFAITVAETYTNSAVPSVTLIEDMSRTAVTQYTHMGGAWSALVPNSTYLTITMLNGRFQEFTFGNSTSAVRLPPITNIPEGGPIFVLRTISATGTDENELQDSEGNLVHYMNSNETIEVFAYMFGGLKLWAVVACSGFPIPV